MPYDTKLTPSERSAYDKWIPRQSKILGRDISKDTADYDVAGLFKSVRGADLTPGHGPDTYKKPNHPTFSQESIYSNAQQLGGRWTTENGQDVFVASPLNVRTLGVSGLKDYFAKYEPGVKLVLPPTLSDLLMMR